MPTIQTRGSLSDLGREGLGPKFEQVFEQNLIKYDGRDVASKVFNFENTSDSVIRTTGLTGYGYLSEFDEGAPVPEVSNTKTFETLYNIRDYGGLVNVTDDYLQDHVKLGAALDEMANLAAAADITEVRSSFQILNAGFGTSATSQGTSIHRYNSEALYSATHARADGGATQSNTSTLVLTELNLETVRLALVKQLTDIGQPIMNMGTLMLVVPDDLEKNAVIFTESESRPTTANNDINFYRGRINVISSRWLNAAFGGSATQWFLVSSLLIKGAYASPLKVFRKGGPQYHELPIDKSLNRAFAVKNRYAVGNSDWRGTAGSQGTG